MSPRYSISVIYYGRGDPVLNDDPSHVGIGVDLEEALPSTCFLHHVRCPTQTRYMYDPGPTQPLSSDPVLWGRCTLVDDLSSEDAVNANGLLQAFGEDEKYLPEWNTGNGQDWMVGAVGMLEQNTMLEAGEHAFWKALIGKRAEEVGAICRASGKTWVKGDLPKPDSIDARWSSEEANQADKSIDNQHLRQRVVTMEKLLGGKLLTARKSGSSETS